MRGLLRWLWRAFNLLGVVLSLRRWWRTVTDEEEKRETRILAGVLMLGMIGLLVWSLLAGWPRDPFGARDARFAGAPADVYADTDQIVVDFADTLPLGAIERLDDALDIDLVPNSPESVDERLMVADVHRLSPAARRALVERLQADPRVEAASANFEVRLLGEPLPVSQAAPAMMPNDPRFGEQWNFQMIGMPAAWEKATGKGVVVAVIDTGVAFERVKGLPIASDLRQTKWTKPYDFVGKKKQAFDDHGHGTHVAGTIAQSTNNNHGVAGIAYEATIMPLKVLSAQGSGRVSDIADAIHYAADEGAQVINMSLGGPMSSPVMRKACEEAGKQGVVIVCAAGNSGREGVGYPAAYPECIAVSAVGPSGDLTFYSSWGKEVAIAAPGGEYRSQEDRQNGILQNTVFKGNDVFEAWQGTSMASPHVAGVAALLVGQGVTDPEAVKQRLQQTAVPKDDAKKYGAGVLNAAAAVGAGQARIVRVTTVTRLSTRDGVTLMALLAMLAHLWLVMTAQIIVDRPSFRQGKLPAEVLVGGLVPAAALVGLGARYGAWVLAAATFAGLPLAAVALLAGVKGLRAWLPGAAFGVGGGALAAALLGLAPAVWLLPNVVACAALGGLLLKPRR